MRLTDVSVQKEDYLPSFMRRWYYGTAVVGGFRTNCSYYVATTKTFPSDDTSMLITRTETPTHDDVVLVTAVVSLFTEEKKFFCMSA